MAASLRVPLALPDWQELNRRTAQMSTNLEGWREQHTLNAASYFAIKGMWLVMLGDLTVLNQYNVSSIDHPAVGVYDLTVVQPTIYGIDTTDLLVPSLEVLAPGAEQGHTVEFEGKLDADTVRIRVREFYLSGVNLRIRDYDLGPAEKLWFMGLLNVELDGAEPIPA